MSKQLVDDVWLGCVQRHAVVADVLRGKEHLEGETVQKVTGRQQTTHRSQREPGSVEQKVGQVGQLWNVVC